MIIEITTDQTVELIEVAGAGPQGAKGDAATLDVGTVTVVNPDQPPSVVNSGDTGDAVFDFDLPRAADVGVGTVATVDPLDPATVTNVGTDGDIVLDFEIPRGAGLPTGGAEFDLVEKASGADFDTRYTNTPTVRGLQLDTVNQADPETGRIIWNDGDQVPQFFSNGVTVDLSLEMLARCRNVTGSLIPRGTAVCIVGASAQRISIAPSDRTQPGSACRTLGLTLEDIPNNQFGKVSTFGLVRGLNTAAIDGDEGDELFVGATPGTLTTTPPDAPARRLTVGYLVTKSPTQGRIFVSIRRGVRVEEIDDVQIGSLSDGDVVRYIAAANRWENVQLGTAADADAGDFDAAGSASSVQSNLDAHTGATTNVHGIADTADLIIEGDARLTDARTPLTHGNEAHAEDYVDASGAAAAAPVQSVNTKTGDVTLNAGDVGADPAGSASGVQSNLTTHIDDDTNPHQVTATQVGLGNVDDTADLDKPISTATQSALDDKADKTTEVIAGTGLDGGGDLSESRTLNLDSATVASLGKADTALQSGDNVSLLTNDASYIDAAGAPVQSVNGETGAVDLDSGDIGYDNASSGLSATNVQGAIDEVKTVEIDSLIAGAQTGNQLMWDDFNRANGAPGTAPTGQSWIVVADQDVQIVGNRLVAQGSGFSDFNLAYIDFPVKPVYRARWLGQPGTTASASRMTFIFAFVDVDNYLSANVVFNLGGSASNIQIAKTVSGTTTAVASGASVAKITPGTVHSLQYQCTVGNDTGSDRIFCVFNVFETNLAFSFTDSDYTLFEGHLNKIGFGSTSRRGTFDLVEVSG